MSEHQHYFIVNYLGQQCPETNKETINCHYKLFDTLHAIMHIYHMSMGGSGSGRDDRYLINYEDIQLFGVLVSAAILKFIRCLMGK